MGEFGVAVYPRNSGAGAKASARHSAGEAGEEASARRSRGRAGEETSARRSRGGAGEKAPARRSRSCGRRASFRRGGNPPDAGLTSPNPAVSDAHGTVEHRESTILKGFPEHRAEICPGGNPPDARSRQEWSLTYDFRTFSYWWNQIHEEKFRQPQL